MLVLVVLQVTLQVKYAFNIPTEPASPKLETLQQLMGLRRVLYLAVIIIYILLLYLPFFCESLVLNDSIFVYLGVIYHNIGEFSHN